MYFLTKHSTHRVPKIRELFPPLFDSVCRMFRQKSWFQSLKTFTPKTVHVLIVPVLHFNLSCYSTTLWLTEPHFNLSDVVLHVHMNNVATYM